VILAGKQIMKLNFDAGTIRASDPATGSAGIAETDANAEPNT